jgi:hypothetical protein
VITSVDCSTSAFSRSSLADSIAWRAVSSATDRQQRQQPDDEREEQRELGEPRRRIGGRALVRGELLRVVVEPVDDPAEA